MTASTFRSPSDAAPDETEVRALILRVLDIASVEGEVTRQDVAQWDSLKHMELVFALEDRYGVRFDEDEFANLTSPKAIVSAVARKLAP